MTLTNKGHNLVFCHQCPFGGLRAGSTEACVVGNDGVRSLRDNEASSRKRWSRNRERKRRPPIPGGRELGLCGMVNIRE
jgi:hypothetical protein